MRPFSKRAERRSMSPQAGLDASTVSAGESSCPTLRGLRKCSSRRAEYTSVIQLCLMHSVEGQVAAAVIERDGLILIGQRKRGSRHSLKWEFPGGKLEAGETPQAALQRELREELGIEAVIGAELDCYDVQYSGGAVTRLYFFRVTEFTGEPQNLDFEQIVWERRGRLAAYDFLEGDVAFVRGLGEH